MATSPIQRSNSISAVQFDIELKVASIWIQTESNGLGVKIDLMILTITPVSIAILVS